MPKYKIEDISRELKQNDWELLSTEYINLDSELKMLCPEKHTVYISYGKWRKNHECPVCKLNPLNNVKEIKVPRKIVGDYRVLALDQSTQANGWAIFDNKKLICYGKITLTQATSAERINGLKEWLISLISNSNPDLIAIEDIQLQQMGPKSGDNIQGVTTYKVLAQLQGVLINHFFANKIPYEIANVSKWREYCQIKGKARADKKRNAQLKVKEWYDVSVSQDEADAICIGKYICETTHKKVVMNNWE